MILNGRKILAMTKKEVSLSHFTLFFCLTVKMVNALYISLNLFINM